jgi:hypothetical protein
MKLHCGLKDQMIGGCSKIYLNLKAESVDYVLLIIMNLWCNKIKDIQIFLKLKITKF